MFSQRDETYCNYHIDNSTNDQPTLNTPPIRDVFNIEDEHKKSAFDWNDDFLPSTAYTSTSADEQTWNNSNSFDFYSEMPSTATTSGNEIQTTTSTNSLIELLPIPNDGSLQYSQQDSAAVEPGMIPPIDTNESNVPGPNLNELEIRGIEHGNSCDPTAEEAAEQDPSNLIDTSATPNDTNEEPVDTSTMNYLYASPALPSNQTRRNTSANTETFLPINTVSSGYFCHPIIPKDRIRYESELDDNKFTAKMSYVKDCFSEHPIRIGPYDLFGNEAVEIALLATAPDGGIIYSPHGFYSQDKPKGQRCCNPIYLQRAQFKIENIYIKLDLQILKTLHFKFPRASAKIYPGKETHPCIIKLYLTGEEKHVDLKPRKLNKDYHLDTMFLGIRRVKPQPDGASYRADPASPIIYSNRFIGVDSKNSPTTWNYDESKLKILETKIINGGVSMHRNDSCQLEFKLQVPELYHCTLKSGSKQLQIKLMTGENINPIYKIACGETTVDTLHLPVKDFLIDVLLTIVKQTAPEDVVWLETLPNQVHITVFNHFNFEFCLQDVDTTGPRSYPNSNVNSSEFIDISTLANIQPTSSSENHELQHSRNEMHHMTDKRRHDDNEYIAGTLPVTKVRKTTGE